MDGSTPSTRPAQARVWLWLRRSLLCLGLVALLALGGSVLPAQVPPAIGADASSILYLIANQRQLLRYDGRTGAFIDVMIAEINADEFVFGPDGNIYVGGHADHASVIRRYDGRTGAFIDFFVSGNSGGLAGSVGLAFGPDGNLYVSSALNNSVIRYNGKTGAFIDVFIGTGAYPPPGPGPTDGFSSPDKLLFGPDGDLYVSNWNTNIARPEIRRYNIRSGALLGRPLPVPGDTCCLIPDMVFGPDRNLYVIVHNCTYTSCGDPLTQIWRYDVKSGAATIFVSDTVPYPGPAQYKNSIGGLAFGPDGNLYLSTHPINQVRRYNGKTGVFIDVFVTRATIGGVGGPGFLTFRGMAARKPSDPDTAFVTVAQQTSPNRQAARGQVVTYTIITTNRGTGAAANSTVTLPFDPAVLRVLDAQFSRPGAWVSKLQANALEFETGRIGSRGDVVTATLRLQVLPEAPLGAAVGTRLSYRWKDARGAGTGASNLPPLVVGESELSQALYDLVMAPASAAESDTRHFSAAIFVPGEAVSLWYNAPGGEVVGLTTVTANAEGRMDYDLRIAGLGAGEYTLVAYGQWSSFTALGRFEVP